ncbi:MAG: DUF58 domain-containing protein [Desulfatibacillaceae bacterium]
MLPKELYSQVQLLHFSTRHKADDLFAGHYASAFKGKGMEFSEVREYIEGDDVRDIDWNVTARFGHPFVKVFSEERELTVAFLVDISASNLFGTKNRFKREVIAEICGVLAFTAIRTNDKVGAVLFGEDVTRFISPRKGAAHVWRLIRDVYTEPAVRGFTDLAVPLDYANRVLRRHSVVFMISDFLGTDMDDRFALSMAMASRKHDVTAVRVTDPAEWVLPRVGLFRCVDPESGQVVVADTSNRRLRGRWERTVAEQDARIRRVCARAGVDLVDISTGDSVVKKLTEAFRKKERRR